MRSKYNFFVIALAFLFLVALFIPSNAYAQSPSSNIATMCNDGTFDQSVLQNRSAAQQGLLTHAQNIGLMYPISSALSSCVQQIANVLKELPSIANPFSAGNFIFTAMLAEIATATCNSVMDSISSAQTALTNFTKICLPLPSFNPFELPTLGGTGCTGDIQINALTNFTVPPTAAYNYTQYQSQ